ncbi:MAG: hypothetical protein J6B91_09530 [Prevotella sp.]|nr:hypothetical protein [Prevotella sp.]
MTNNPNISDCHAVTRIIAVTLVAIIPCMAWSQESFDDFKKRMTENFSSYKAAKEKEFEDFRNKANNEYTAFVSKAWKEFYALKGIPTPKEDKPVPPKVYPDDDKNKPIKDKPVVIDEVIPEVKPEPQPDPVVPIKEAPTPAPVYHTFAYLGTEMKVRLDNNHRFHLNGCNERNIAEGWKTLSGDKYNNVINDCLNLRQKYRLCDWAYLQMLNKLSQSFFNGNSREATLLTAFLYCQSGYKMRLGTDKDRLFLLFASKHEIYNKSYWNIDGEMFYPLDCDQTQIYICQAAFPQEKPLSLLVSTEQLAAYRPSKPRTLQSKRYPEIKANVSINENLIEFFNSYPTSMINNDFGTRWAMYANTPLGSATKAMLYPTLRTSAISNLTQSEAANRLLNFVQTAFTYEYDDKVWGCDRAFFAEETLFYPYCDCEDRSILFSRLVRDLLGLDVVLIFYPGHLATAVHFTDNVTGDYIMLNGKRYVVCDPTYIGAPIGATMPGMDNAKAKVIIL